MVASRRTKLDNFSHKPCHGAQCVDTLEPSRLSRPIINQAAALLDQSRTSQCDPLGIVGHHGHHISYRIMWIIPLSKASYPSWINPRTIPLITGDITIISYHILGEFGDKTCSTTIQVPEARATYSSTMGLPAKPGMPALVLH